MRQVLWIATMASGTWGFQLLGCFEPSVTQTYVRSVNSVQKCVDACRNRTSLVSLFGPNCACTADKSTLTLVSSELCSFKCDDSLACGAFPTRQLVSLYEYPVESEGSRPSPTDSPQIITLNDASGKRSNVALVASTVAAAILVLLLALGFVVYRKRARLSKTPRLESDSPLGYLIPNILPRTKNMIYSVFSDFRPRYYGELVVARDELVIVKHVFDDSWAFGVNMKTSESGYFPLGVLVSDQKWVQEHFIEPPVRKESLVDLPRLS